ncbi:MAG: hypothetical protein PHC34_01875 [Candidatus Gastranaerophilales bacterium]|nr:hypothetical protein [Candidatus Gastranaerophilales bacterium]
MGIDKIQGQVQGPGSRPSGPPPLTAEQQQAIKNYMKENNCDERTAARAVLGEPPAPPSGAQGGIFQIGSNQNIVAPVGTDQSDANKQQFKTQADGNLWG